MRIACTPRTVRTRRELRGVAETTTITSLPPGARTLLPHRLARRYVPDDRPRKKVRLKNSALRTFSKNIASACRFRRPWFVVTVEQGLGTGRYGPDGQAPKAT